MPAPSLQVLLDGETELENALLAYLGTTLQVSVALKSDTNAPLTSPRIELKATKLRDENHQYQITSGSAAGLVVFDQMTFRLNLDLVYSPTMTDQNQAILKGLLRRALLNYDGINAALAVNGYYYLAKYTLKQTDGDRVINDAEKEETVSSVLECQLWIRPTAYPA
jgi:hypothetical protein